ncbi:MAG: flavodoxin family protein [Patescibacteria group bacterium]
MSKKILVLGINGSPHNAGTTGRLLKNFLAKFKKSGAETKLINLKDYKINACKGCYSTDPKTCKYPCIQKDGMQKIYPQLLKADAIIFGTPIYWFNMSGLMKNFFDRLCCLAANGYLMEGKIGVFFSASKENEGGRLNASSSMALAANHLGLFIPPYGIMYYPAKEKVVTNGKVKWDEWIYEDEAKIAKNLISLCQFLQKAKYQW